MADVFDGIPTDGTTKAVIVTTIANPAAPTATELNAVSVKDISCLITSDGLAISADEAAIADNRLCDRENYERRGRVSYSAEVTYVRSAVDADDLAYTTLVPGFIGYLVLRMGADYEDVFATGDEVWVFPIEAGTRRPVPPAPNEVLKRVQKLFIRGKTHPDVLVAAGA